MISYLLDTNHASAVFRNDTVLRERIDASQNAEFSISMPTVGELWYMVFASDRVRSNAGQLTSFIRLFQVWPYNDRSAREFGRIRTELRRRGHPIPSVDAQIAAIARVNDLTVLTADRHFGEVKGLKIENWLDPMK